MKHLPALLGETIQGLNLRKTSFVVDATIDGGGHAGAILKKLGLGGRLVGLDWDNEMVVRLRRKWQKDKRVKLFHLNFAEIAKLTGIRPACRTGRPDAILFDLGLSSLQLTASGPPAGQAGRGFSFQAEEPLEMTFDEMTHPNAKEFLERVSEKELETVIRTYGEEPFARRISAAIIEARRRKPIRTSKELSEIVLKVRPRTGRLHPATKTFQALRIFLNRELENLEQGLAGAWKILKPKGRLAVISYHSLEDRFVKNLFSAKGGSASGGREGKIITKKPIRPSRKEILKNPRSRSAKLRIIEKK